MSVLAPEQAREFEETIARGRALMESRVIWNVNSTARGGGVAEMLASLLAYTRGAGLDARWVVIDGDPAFFRVTKRIHNMLHGSPGDGQGLGRRTRLSSARTRRATRASWARWSGAATWCSCTTPRPPD